MPIDWDELVLAPVMAVFGDEVTYRPRAGAAFTISDAVFDEQYTYVLQAAGPQGEDVNTTAPMLGVRGAVCPNPAQDDQVDVGVFNGRPVNRRFLVKDVRPDNHGHIVLLLGDEGPL